MVDFVNGGSIVTVSSKGPKLKGWRAESGDGIFQFILEWRQRALFPPAAQSGGILYAHSAGSAKILLYSSSMFHSGARDCFVPQDTGR